jgi:hypothetical protein
MGTFEKIDILIWLANKLANVSHDDVVMVVEVLGVVVVVVVVGVVLVVVVVVVIVVVVVLVVVSVVGCDIFLRGMVGCSAFY